MREIGNYHDYDDIYLRTHKNCLTIREIMNDYYIDGLLPCIDTLLEREEIYEFEF